MTRKRSDQLIIFDYDGVLVDSLPVQQEIYRRLINEMGLDKSHLNKASGSGDFFYVDYRTTLKDIGVETPEGVSEAEERYCKHIVELRKEIKPFPFIAKLLETLAKDHQLAIVSNNHSSEIANVLADFGLAKHFDLIIGPPEHKILKPEPDQLIACMKKAGARPDDTTYVGDMNGDILAAKRAGVRSVGVTWGFHSRNKLKDADFIIDKPEELIEVIANE